MRRAIVLLFLAGLSSAGWTRDRRPVSANVDVFWGSGATSLAPSEGVARGWNWEKAQTGNTHPGAVLPFGWVSACAYSGAYPTGYGRLGCTWSGPAAVVDERPLAYGISHFHHSGTGWIAKFYNYLLVTPFLANCNTGKPSRLDAESAEPGFYAGRLTDYGAAFEVAPMRNAACHRYRFDSTNGWLLVDATNIGLRRKYVRPANYAYLGERVESVSVVSSVPFGWEGTVRAYGCDLHFAVLLKGQFAEPFANGGAFGCRVAGTEAEVCVGFSRTSVAQARTRAESARTLGFEVVRKRAAAAWESLLSRIQVRFADARMTGRFYSALYHSLVKPCETDGGFVDFSTLWDVYKTELPLVLSLAPETGRGILEHFMRTTEEKGFSPICQIMDAAVIHKDVQATALPLFTLGDGFFRGILTQSDYPRIKSAAKKELAHADIRGMSPTHALDLSGACGAMAFVAEACGDGTYAQELRDGAEVWKTVYDAKTGLLPERATFYEGNHWNYSFRPHPGMNARIGLAGGPKRFCDLLDAFFGFGASAADAWTPESDRRQRPGRFEGLNNECDMEAPFAYLWCGRSDRTAEIVDLVRRCRFSDGPGGCPGNNDSGATSSWYVWSCLGLHPLAGTSRYLLGTPSVERADILFSRGKLTIAVKREGPKSIYPIGYEWNGKPFDEPWIGVSDLEGGGELVFRLGDRPRTPSPAPQWL